MIADRTRAPQRSKTHPTQSVVCTSARRLDEVVADLASLSLDVAQSRIGDGAAYVAGKRCRDGGRVVAVGQAVRLETTAPASRATIGGGGLVVVYADDRLVVVDKPAGLPTQPPPRGGDALSLRVQRWLGPHAYLGEVHRLDRDASGLVVYGRDRKATADLAGQFRDHSAQRRYLALVRTWVPPADQRIAEPVAEVTTGVMATAAGGMPATTDVTVLGFSAEQHLALVDLRLHSGRSHQIRVHLAWAIGPILGDHLYGDPNGPHRERIALHAGHLALYHPNGATMQWTRLPPSWFWPAEACGLAVPSGWPST